MPTYTSRLGLPLPLGTEFHNLENYKALINKIDQTAAAKADVDSHVGNKSNPHATTAAQVGAYTKAESDQKLTTGLASKTDIRGYSNKYVTGIGGTDLNTLYESGTFAGGSLVNAPNDAASTFIIQNLVHTNNWIVQSAYALGNTSGLYYVRKCISGTWTPWDVQALTSSNVASATKLNTARKIAGVFFDGTADIAIPASGVGAYTKAEVDSRIATTVGGNVASATKLQTARTINGVAFDGTSDITVQAQPESIPVANDQDLNTLTKRGFYHCGSNSIATTLKNSPTVNAFNMIVLGRDESGIQTQILSEYMVSAGSRTFIRKRYQPSTGEWGSWYPLSVGDGTMQSGLYAQTASRLATARAITLTGGVTGSATFDGTATTSIATTIVGNAPTATTATKLATARTISLTGGVTGSTTFDGSGNVSIAATLAGNAPTATKLATARTINGKSFDGTADIEITADPDQKIIPANTNLDNLTTPGFWSSNTDSNTMTMTNTPFGTASFVLQVETGNVNSRIVQTAKRFSNGDVAVRYKLDNMAFSAWITLAKKDGYMQAGLFAEKANKLNAARTINVTGAVTGSVAFDGSGNVTLATTAGSTVVNTSAAQTINGAKEFTTRPTAGGAMLAKYEEIALPMKGLLSGTIDWDSLTEIGLYYANGITNKPNLCSNYGHLEVISQINTANVTQRYTDINGTTIQRSYVGGGAGWTAWKLVAYDSGWQSLAYVAPFTHYNSATIDIPKIRRINNQVYVTGVATVTKELPTNTDAIMMLSAPMPSWARSDNTVYGVQQGTGQRSWLLTAYTSGNLGLSRYGLTTGEAVQAGHWLPYNMTWFVTYDPGI